MSDYALSHAYWSRMRDTKSPPTVPWVDDDPANVYEMLQIMEVEYSFEKPPCGSFTRLYGLVRFVTEYVWDSL